MNPWIESAAAAMTLAASFHVPAKTIEPAGSLQEAAIAAVESGGGTAFGLCWARPVTRQVDDATVPARRLPRDEACNGSVVAK